MSKVLIVGGGAAGMFAAIQAAENGHEVHVFEKNEKLGRKLFITGKGRCNLTNACEVEELFPAVLRNASFLYSSFYGYTNWDVIAFFEKIGVKTKIERGNRVFPASDHSFDVVRALALEMKRLGVTVHLRTEVKELLAENGRFAGLILKGADRVEGDACILATGGMSYPSTGSTGDGYRWAEELGHQVTKRIPALVPLAAKESWVPALQGLSLKNVRVKILEGSRKLFEEFGEMIFTHYGVSGPVILSASSAVGEKLLEKSLVLQIDLKPALSSEQLDHRLLRDFEENKNRQFKNALGRLFPAKLIPVMIKLSKISAEKRVHEVSREERKRFVNLIKDLTIHISGLRGFDEAIITRGGIVTREVNPATMESKIIKNLHFAGEILDLDAVTGGFNLQIAWSTAHAAGRAVL